MALLIEIKAADGLVSRTRLEAGVNRFSVRLGDSYRVIDDQTGQTPPGLAVKRVDNNLVVERLGSGDTTVELAEFYSVCSAGSPCDLIVDSGSGSTPVAITPGTQPIGALADGAFVLYDPSFAETAPPPPSGADATIVRNVLYGVGGLAVLGLAVGGGGGGGDDAESTPDNLLRLTSSPFVNSRTPTLTGEGQPGSRVIVRIDTNTDGVPDVVYNTPVGSDGKWSVNLAAAAPESGALPAGGLPPTSNVSITSTSTTGNTSLPIFPLSFDPTPPAAPVIAAITGDDRISISEKADGVIVSGTAEANASVIVNWGAQSRPATVDDQGRWQASFPSTAIGADGPVQIRATATDRAGNIGEASARTATVNTLPQIGPVSGDGSISLGEWARGVAVSGTNPAGTRAGVAMTVTVGEVSKVVQTDAAGNWSAVYSPAELPNNGSAAVTAVASVGGLTSATATGTARISTLPTIAPVSGDGVITLAERASGVTVSGSTPAGTGAGIAMTVGLGQATKPAVTDANGNWSAAFPADAAPLSGTIEASAVATAGGASSQRATAAARADTAPTLNGPVAGDGIINLAELTGNTTRISGSAPPGSPDGSQVIVTLQGLAPVTATVSGGSWSLPVSGLGLAPANANYAIRVVGSVGGVTGEAVNGQVAVDVTPSPITGIFVAGADNRISRAELPGFSVVGTSEPGSSIRVTLAGVEKPVVSAPNGTWTAQTFRGSDFPSLAADPDGPLALVVTVTNREGNVSQFTQSVPVDPLPLPLPLPLAEAPTADALVATTTQPTGLASAGVPGTVPASAGLASAASLASTDPVSKEPASKNSVPAEPPPGAKVLLIEDLLTAGGDIFAAGGSPVAATGSSHAPPGSPSPLLQSLDELMHQTPV
jgi:hypothetical protein